MTLTESDARQLLEVLRGRLSEIGAREILDGIEESRRLGVEETLSGQDAKELKQVGAMRRRPLSAVEELSIVLSRLEERLVVLPRLASSTKEKLKTDTIEWRVDTEFVSEDRIPEVSIARLLPEGNHAVGELIAEIMKRAGISSAGKTE